MPIKYRRYKKICFATARRIINAFRYSFDGFKSTYKTEPAFRQDLVIFFIGIILTFYFDITKIERVALIACLFFIFTMELVNTAIEVIIDRISRDTHLLSKKAKDIGSLLVLLSFISSIIVWLVILL